MDVNISDVRQVIIDLFLRWNDRQVEVMTAAQIADKIVEELIKRNAKERYERSKEVYDVESGQTEELK